MPGSKSSKNNSTTNIADENLRKFLNKHTTPGDFTHTAMSKSGGKYYIPDDKTQEFFELYSEAIDHGKIKLHLTERHLPNAGPICIDFDFKFDNECNPRLITKSIIKIIVERLTIILVKMFGNDIFPECFVLQRPVQCKKKDIWTDGIHIQFPYIVCEYLYQFILRSEFIKDPIPGLDTCTNSISDMYDKCVIKSNNWCMYGSTKENIPPYELKWIFNSHYDLDDFIGRIDLPA